MIRFFHRLVYQLDLLFERSCAGGKKKGINPKDEC